MTKISDHILVQSIEDTHIVIHDMHTAEEIVLPFDDALKAVHAMLAFIYPGEGVIGAVIALDGVLLQPDVEPDHWVTRIYAGMLARDITGVLAGARARE